MSVSCFRQLCHNAVQNLSQSEAPPEAPSSPCFWRMHRYDPSWPHISQEPKKEESKRENGDIAWRRSSLSQAWAAEIVEVTIYATRCRHFLSFFPLFWPRKDSWDMWGHEIVAVHPPETGRRRSLWRSLQTGTDFTWHCDVIGLQMLLWRIQTLDWDTAGVSGSEVKHLQHLVRPEWTFNILVTVIEMWDCKYSLKYFQAGKV